MKFARNWMIIVGLFYLSSVLQLWPSLFGPMLPSMYPGVELHQAEPIFRLLTDAWLAVGVLLSAVGLVFLWGAREPAKNLILVPIAISCEVFVGCWDVYSITMSYQLPTVAAFTMAIHIIIIVTGIIAWKKAGGAQTA
jgi:CHASE2 domain-containing sensor protein